MVQHMLNQIQHVDSGIWSEWMSDHISIFWVRSEIKYMCLIKIFGSIVVWEN